jgi:hypothetical protein
MSWTITPQTKVPVDPQYGSVSLLLHGNGTNGSTTITDNSPSPKTVTAVGNAQISTAQSKFGGSSIAFDGNGDYITSASNAEFAFGTGDFTIEFWHYISSTVNQAFFETIPIGGISVRNNGFVLVIDAGKWNVYSSGGFRGQSTNTPSTNQWVHFALVRSGTTWTYYANGTSNGSFTYSVNLTQSNFVCGRVGDDSSYFINGYLDDYRITKGIARYTANFTPPAAPFPDI